MPGGVGGAVRPIELARAAGVSTQQVRRLEDLGVLPPVRRSAGGHRRYGPQHLAALRAYTALAGGMGASGAVAALVPLWRGEIAAVLERIDAGHGALHDERVALAELADALAALAADPAGAGQVPDDNSLAIGDLARRLGVRTSALRVWESAGLLSPARERGTGYRRYGPGDVRDARAVQLLRRSGYLFDAISPVIAELRRAGGTPALQATLERRREVLFERSRAMITGARHLAVCLELLAADGTMAP
ncbi:MerR family transcriptional regulator [Naumannella huperziae]